MIDGETRNCLIAEDPNSAEVIRPFVVGDDIRKYRIDYKERYLIFARRGIEISKYPVIGKESRFTLDDRGAFSNDKSFIIPLEEKYLLGVLNSKVFWQFLKRICSVLGDSDNGGRLELRTIHLSQLPIPKVPSPDTITPLVSKMLELHKNCLLYTSPSPRD